MMRTHWKLGLTVTLLFLSLGLFAADWPQWDGPERTGVSSEKGLLKQWPKGGPKLLWTYKDAGTGFTAPAVIGEVVYTMGARQGQECLIALDGKGHEKWSAKIGPLYDFKGNQWSAGPNATPTVDGNLIYALSSGGDLVCVSTDGKEVWRKNLPQALEAQVNAIFSDQTNLGWGFCWSPLVDGEHLILTPGGPKGLFAALDKKKGDVLWQNKSATDQVTYASPIAVQVKGVRQYIAVVQDGCVGVAAQDGALLWRYKRAQPFGDIVGCTPRFSNDHVFITGKGGCDLVEIESADGKTFTAKAKVKSKEMQNLHGGVVVVDKVLYGSDQERSWKALDFMNPKKVEWDSGREGVGGGSLIAADGMLYVVSADDGTVALLEASPKEYSEKGTFKLPEESKLRKVSTKVWTHPVVANGRLYLRDQELIFCYEVK
jgi:outer membrane protein assembly factor BamB